MTRPRSARALDRWVGPALDEFADEPWAIGDAVRLGEIRATAVEDLADALIAGGRVDEAIARLEPHLIEHPYRDRPRGLMMRALAAAGRTTEALRVYQTYRTAARRRGRHRTVGGAPRHRAAHRGGLGRHRAAMPNHRAPFRTVPTHRAPAWELAEVLAAAPPLVGRRAERRGARRLALDRARQQGPGVVLARGRGRHRQDHAASPTFAA